MRWTGCTDKKLVLVAKLCQKSYEKTPAGRCSPTRTHPCAVNSWNTMALALSCAAAGGRGNGEVAPPSARGQGLLWPDGTPWIDHAIAPAEPLLVAHYALLPRRGGCAPGEPERRRERRRVRLNASRKRYRSVQRFPEAQTRALQWRPRRAG
jgi:hypothetical protein